MSAEKTKQEETVNKIRARGYSGCDDCEFDATSGIIGEGGSHGTFRLCWSCEREWYGD